MTNRNREIRLASRPSGPARTENFALAETEIPEPGAGQILVRNTWMSVDPFMRGLMDAESDFFLPQYEIGQPLYGGAVGEVVASRADGVPVGATVSHFLGWREYAVVDAAEATVIDTGLAPANAYLGPLGTTGLTAWAALTDVAPVREGDVVFVSAAAGAVGSIAGQIARRLGAAKVIGSAGGPDKAKRLVHDFGFDAALDYKRGDLAGQLAAAAPDGIDLYVDNVGGDHLEAAIDAMRTGGRAALIGSISGYEADVPGPRNLERIVLRQLTLRGVQVSAYFDRFPEFIAQAAGWLADGSLRSAETVVEGIEQAPAAFLGVLSGANTGKMLVRLP
ncbi:NADP-dependent oxidoreductase [Actinomadura hibisca]|uniref:NADP-dependent oxidoreductase n=1 Tax=Actinomadura hibisca TaxID=68565 RepID=UPI00082BAF8C|nr:NADP-dependent oxidoreductase [Actinomadura hibisca]